MIIVKDIVALFKSFKTDKKLLTPKEKQLAELKRLIWIYFWLLLLEGALRKWFLPFLSTPLLIVRDPVAMILLFKAQNAGYFKINAAVATAWGITALSLVMTMLVGHHNITIALYGARIMIVQFPVMFLIASIFTREDVLKMGEVVLWIAMPMTVLMGLQFYSPQTAWVNRGVGGDMEGAGFSGAMGYFRPPGTFSFTNGLVGFFGFVTAFVLYFWLEEKSRIPKWLLLAVSACLVAAIPLSISRTFLFQMIISVAFAVVIAIRNPKLTGRFVLAGLCVMVFVTLLGKTSFFQTGTEAFNSRLTSANDAEGGAEGVFVGRFLGGMLGGIIYNQKVPFFGYGLGLGTNAGAKLLTGETKFLFNAEVEWGRVLGEMGVLLGMIIVLTRIVVSFDMIFKSFTAIGKKNYLPWMLISFVFVNILQGQWSQPTAQGFGVLTGGLILAALKAKPKKVLARR